jgi:hypothetical protein
VENTAQCIDTVRRHSNAARVFTFGIGADASKELVAGMAKGTADNWLIVTALKLERESSR